MSQLRPVYFAPDELRAKTELPLLGVVTRVVTQEFKQRQRSSLLRFFAASGSLVGLFVVGMIFLTVMSSKVGANL
jgi:uncharacterized membrane protein